MTLNFTGRILTKKNGKTARHNFRTGKTWLHLKKGARSSEDGLRQEAREQADAWGWKVTDRDCAVTLTFSWNGRADAIGLAETVLDAMQGVVYKNDKQVRVLIISMLDNSVNTGEMTCLADVTVF